MVKYKRVGELLVEKGLLSPDHLTSALQAHVDKSIRFGEFLVKIGVITEAEITECLAEQYLLPVVNVNAIEIEQGALKAVPGMTAFSRLVLPIRATEDELFLVLSDPMDIELTDELSQQTNRRLVLSLAPASDLRDKIIRAYHLPMTHLLKDPIDLELLDEDAEDAPEVEEVVAEAPVVEAVAEKPKKAAKKKVATAVGTKRKRAVEPQKDREALLWTLYDNTGGTDPAWM